MHNKKPHIQSVGKIHKVLFDYLVGTGVRTSAITQDGNCPCIGILFPEVIVPDPFDVLADKLRGAVADSHIFAKFAVAESSGLEAFRPRGKKQSSVPFIQTRHVSQLCWREYFWRRFRMHPYNSWLFYKDTKFSPDLLYYIIDNQIINLIFLRRVTET